MKSLTLLLLFAVIICAFSGANSIRPKCPRGCPRIYKPVCATWKRGRLTSRCTFANSCELTKQRCTRNQNWLINNTGKCRRNTRDCLTLLKSS